MVSPGILLTVSKLYFHLSVSSWQETDGLHRVIKENSAKAPIRKFWERLKETKKDDTSPQS